MYSILILRLNFMRKGYPKWVAYLFNKRGNSMGSNKTRLEFYDGWHVDYVYFNSLLKVDTWNEKRDIYDMEFVSRKASEAASDA